MADLKNPRLIYLKGFVFLFTGLTAAALLLIHAPDFRIAGLLLIAVWSFCRFYYFAFYVIEHYVDGGYRYAGLFDFTKHVINSRFGGKSPSAPASPRSDDTGGA